MFYGSGAEDSLTSTSPWDFIVPPLTFLQLQRSCQHGTGVLLLSELHREMKANTLIFTSSPFSSPIHPTKRAALPPTTPTSLPASHPSKMTQPNPLFPQPVPILPSHSGLWFSPLALGRCLLGAGQR